MTIQRRSHPPTYVGSDIAHSSLLGMLPERTRAFTLIELLIVVAIIAILALIAVPNFLEAQVRAKAARVKTDLRGIAVAVEAYAVDVGDYPRNWMWGYGTLPPDLTTPVSYLTSLGILDPFAVYWNDPHATVFPQWKDYTPYYTYNRILPLSEAQQFPADSPWIPGPESTDGPAYNEGALLKYGQWRLLSIGPDRAWIIDMDYDSMDIAYDPTNGSVSFGNLTRTQRHPEGKVLYAPPR